MLSLRNFRPLISSSAGLSSVPSRTILPACARSLATTTDPTASTEPATVPPPLEPSSQAQLPYFVGRNNLNNLAVYHKKKRGGNLKITTLKKGEGNLQSLKQDIRDALELPDRDISVNSTTRAIIIKGHKRNELLSFLHTMGF
ncbi:mitochondrial large subunit ribosomal protein-domain-containing protein [Xylariaceae sp. FL0016]|nr:mitochondrial large subunit ribosomal protein-domain-containing protein [Xylariaceae sp. FL0016]